MICSDNTFKLLILNKLKGIGPKALFKIAKIPDFEKLNIEDLSEYHKNLHEILSNVDIALLAAKNKAQEDVDQAGAFGCRIISFLDDEYPSLLKTCTDRPAILYIKGHWHKLPDQSVAIIGTREPTEHGAIIAQRISQYFVENNWSIVSGLAIGCDTIAHKTAIEMNSHTIAVLSHGLHTIAPKQNKNLASDILDRGGILISEYEFGKGAMAHQYVQRDRIQAALSKGVIMIQSNMNGGSIHASKSALKYNRILAIPYPTKMDIQQKAKQIEANLSISGSNIEEKVELLSCEKTNLDNIFIIKDKEDYASLLSKLSSILNDPVVSNGQQEICL